MLAMGRMSFAFVSYRLKIVVASSRGLCLHKLRLDLRRTLHMVLQCGPAILDSSTSCPAQLRQVLVEPVLLHLLELGFPLLRTRSGAYALAMNLRLACLKLACFFRVFKT